MKKIQIDIGKENYKKRKFEKASEIFSKLSTSDHFEDFLTIPSYKDL